MTKKKSKSSALVAKKTAAVNVDLESAHRWLVGVADLHGVVLLKATSEFRADRLIGQEIENMVLTVLPPSYKYSIAKDKRTLLCGSRLTAILAPPEDKDSKRAVVEITGEYLLTYSIPQEAQECPQQAFLLFARKNGVFNAWPFFRELVHSFASRMDIPSLMLPLLRMPFAPAAKRPPPQPNDEPTRIGTKLRNKTKR